MIRITILLPFILLCSCASTPPVSGRPSLKGSHQATNESLTRESEAAATASPKPTKLAAGRCNDCFDCVDTVGFAPDGYRWACVSSKCVQTKLQGFEATTADAKARKASGKTKPVPRTKSACKTKSACREKQAEKKHRPS
jgi:hypothetical protein